MLARRDRTSEDIEDFINEDDGVDVAAFINDAAAIVYRENWRPLKVELMTPENGYVYPDAVSIDRIETEGGAMLRFEAGAEGIRVFGAAGQVRVYYRYMPPDLSDDEDEPLFPKFAHSCLCDYAAYAISNVGERAAIRGESHMMDFERKRALIPRNDVLGAAFINKYTI
jgi:hypothetical protein